MNSILYSDEYMEKKYINNGNLDVYSSLILSFASNIIEKKLFKLIFFNFIFKVYYFLNFVNSFSKEKK